ncbi:MlaA family lipoprotein [Malaciobacter molluscorum]|uniref:MlaA family lipoprotein n=1 Tax=Malaciobacter molluscorum TaxID=1032072 RepID=UPI001D18EDAB|nr:VacJ family lipoprotein [Malaciobacter molluscorum]
MRKITVLFLILSFFYACNAQNIEKSNKDGVAINQFDDISSEFQDSYENDFDPLSGYNRIMTTFNDKFYVYVSRPVVKTYKEVVHPTARKGVSNFFTNLGFPIRFINNLLQFKFKNSWDELQLFVLNTTFGVGGLINVAEENNFELRYHDEDFGQTLGHWGVGGGFHIVLPILGPSNLRDTFSLFVDEYASPLKPEDKSFYITDSTDKSIGLKTFDKVNSTSYTYPVYDKMRKDAIDLYPYLKDYYNKRREQQIKE